MLLRILINRITCFYVTDFAMHVQNIILLHFHADVFLSCCSPCAQYAGHDTPLVLVGNKRDSEERRIVSQEEGERMATNISAVFLEVNAKTGENIIEV